MPLFEERSPAKINLSLKILGKRADGYHELESVVVFGPDAACVVTLDTDAPEALTILGPFATKLEGENILAKTLARVREAAPAGIQLGAVILEKNLPVAAGLGGGSANAAALLRAIRRANSDLAHSVDWHAIATSLGADVPVCLESTASVMTGIGERVTRLEAPLPGLYAVLVNPQAPVPHDKTARVFRALNAKPVSESSSSPPTFAITREGIRDLMARDGNDLAVPAMSVIPEIRHVLEALAAEPHALAHALSGAGPTAFALFETRIEATRAAEALRAKHPAWWVSLTRLT